jgi:hypothetical protein
MQYLLMCCFEEARWDALPESERDRVMQEYGALCESLAKSGHYRAGAKLASSRAATAVRDHGGRRVLTDGPFAETKEQLGGYHLLECRDLDEALAIAQRIPTLRVGGVVEVRPLVETHS